MNRRLLAILRKETWHILRDWQSLIIIIAMPTFMMFLYGYAFDVNITDVPVLVVDPEPTPETAAIEKAIDKSSMLKVSGIVRTAPDPLEVFRTTNIRAVVRFAHTQKLFAALFNMLILYPGTALYEDLYRQGRLLKPEWWLDPLYVHGSAVLKPQRMSAAELEQSWLSAQREFYSPGSILQRFLEPHANARDPWRALTFLLLNLPAYGEEMQRYGKPLGLNEFAATV